MCAQFTHYLTNRRLNSSILEPIVSVSSGSFSQEYINPHLFKNQPFFNRAIFNFMWIVIWNCTAYTHTHFYRPPTLDSHIKDTLGGQGFSLCVRAHKYILWSFIIERETEMKAE